ncbi:MAG TPA: DUF1801 domain-containing protein [Candidatus Limnocylindrales bacterium]
MDDFPPEALLDDFPPPMQAIAHRLREVVKTAMPEAIERVRIGWRIIGYDLPIGRRQVYFAFVMPENEHVHLGFAHGWAMADSDGLLKGEGVTKRVRWLTFDHGDDIDVDRCVDLVREAADIAAMTRGERALLSMDREGDKR